MRCLTEQVYVDEIEQDDNGIAEMLDETSVAQLARPGTSLRTAKSSRSGLSTAMRPTTQSGRPLTGSVGPGTQSGGRPGTMEQAIKTPRSAYTARPLTSSSGRSVRLGTASMLSNPDQFINLSRLNFTKYAQIPYLAKPLFEYIFYHENDIRGALQLASLATELAQFNDWWWKVQVGKCYYRLGMFREAEKQFLSALKQHKCVDNFLYVAKVYVKRDQPLNAIAKLKEGNKLFASETTLLQGIARIHEGLDQMDECTKFYRECLNSDSTHIEATASLATNYFYSDQPEVALKFYRRLLQMGVYSAEMFNNIGLCCFYAQQYDMIFLCFERALNLASDDMQLADIWFNLGHVALGVGDSSLAYQCFRLSLSYNSDSPEAYNNLGVLELAHNRTDLARSFFQASQSLGPMMFESYYNNGFLSFNNGDLQTSYQSLKKSTELFANHASSKEILKELEEKFSVL